MSERPPTPYDEVLYPGLAHVQTHPDRLATLATLFGMQPAPVERCRVLELGCGDGTNLVSMALALPESEFEGVDYARSAVAAGNEMIDRLALRNIRLRQADIAELDLAGERYDYIIAHGIYSWVPEPVRDRILAICQGSLAPNGVAYVSYNAYPGCHLRDMARRMMIFHVRGIRDPAQRIGQARALLKFLATSRRERDLYTELIEKELEHALEYSDHAFFHDDLNECNHPCYLHEFLEHAGRHGLHFLGDAMFNEMHPDGYAPSVIAALKELDEDIIAREQYLDFLMCRRFRRTLLCHRGISLDHKVRLESIVRFYASSSAEPVSKEPDLAGQTVEEFRTTKGASLQTQRPLAKAAMWHLGKTWPRTAHFGELLAEARRLAPDEAERDRSGAENTRALCDILLRAYAAGVIELHVWRPEIAADVSERPIASPLVRWQCGRGGARVTTLRHTGLELTDEITRRLLELLDGSRAVDDLVEELARFVEARKISLVAEGMPVTDPQEIRKTISAELPVTLKRLARSAVLVG